MCSDINLIIKFKIISYTKKVLSDIAISYNTIADITPTLLKKFGWILLYMTDDAIAKLYVT